MVGSGGMLQGTELVRRLHVMDVQISMWINLHVDMVFT